ncbi:MAG: ATP-binding protein, partial [Candidatus Cloacimonetes bacterium]|nr:ATP-binding protein [Candidatus Cloacimonadota bacterium]
QALINILRNAADALAQRHDTPGIIRISASEEQRQLQLEIADNGPGLSPGALENLFTPFFTTRPNGQGIGLTLVRDILGNHGLRFTLENSSEGGAVFRLWIPAA